MATVCPKCQRPAPRLLTYQLAHRTTPTVECPRCAYPQQRYLGAWVDTMPAADTAWYATPPDTVVQEGTPT